MRLARSGICVVLWLNLMLPALAQRQMENLNRGLVAVKQADGMVYVAWRLFGTDPRDLAFNLYRITDNGAPVKVSEVPVDGATNFVDHQGDSSRTLQYYIRPVLQGKELAACQPARLWEQDYLEIPIQPIAGYRPGDASVADLDGDGDYEIVLHQVSNGRDNSHAGITGTPVFDAYELDGTHLWRIDLGINIRDGEHYTQFMVYDLDGDGRAEMACKTADGTRDGQGKVIGDKDKDWRIHKEGDRLHGRILEGPEFLTIFDGRTGAALKTVDYLPNRYPIDGWGGIGGNGGNDSYGNRCDRFLACVAYLDGKRPSLVMCRGVYGRSVMVAWDWRDSQLTQRWVFDSGSSAPPFTDASPYSGMGGHSLSVADVDSDGLDEIVYHAMVVDDNGQGLHSSGFRHGDAMHISDMDPDRPGLEVFTIHENEGRTVRFQSPGAALRDAWSGDVLWKQSPGIDVGAGLAADIDPRHRGYEMWGGPGDLRDTRGNEIGPKPRNTRWAIWWDGDLLRELLSGSTINKWNWEAGKEEELFSAGPRGRRGYPCLAGDILGDWREELLIPGPEGKTLRLYTTTLPTKHRLTTLMHDPQYRLAIAWQNVVYNKPPHPGFFLGHDMVSPPTPNIDLIGKGEALTVVSRGSVVPKDYAIGADLSFLKQAEDRGTVFKDKGVAKPGLKIFKDHSYNWIRLRLFHTPTRLPNDLDYTIALAQAAKKLGYKFLLNYHYSDTWADPGKQFIPKAWEGKSHTELVETIEAYTRDTIKACADAGVLPDMVQVGNEITPGMLWPAGKLPENWNNFGELLKAAIKGVDLGRADGERPRIMIHIDKGGNKQTTKWFFDKLHSLDVSYDVIGQSFYPWWHGSLQDLRENMAFMANTYDKDIILVEVAYNWRPGEYKDKDGPFPESPAGQRQFLEQVHEIVLNTPHQRGKGVFWWEPAVTGGLRRRGFFDDQGNVLPVIDVFDDVITE